jgi:hypothetical protein
LRDLRQREISAVDNPTVGAIGRTLNVRYPLTPLGLRKTFGPDFGTLHDMIYGADQFFVGLRHLKVMPFSLRKLVKGLRVKIQHLLALIFGHGVQ